MRKNILFGLIILSFVLAGCKQDAKEEKEASTEVTKELSGGQEEVTETATERLSDMEGVWTDYAEYLDSISGATMDIQKQIEVFAQNRDKWATDIDFADEQYKFTLADLDMDGQVELLVSNTGGTGFFTSTSFYNVDKNGKLKVMASFYTMYDFAKKIGKDKIEVTNMVPAGTEPHDWEPSTKDLIELEKSDVFIYNGAGMEQWVDDVLESLDTEELTSVEASKGIKLLKDTDAYEHDHEHESENDPHVWLDPQNAKYEMNQIKKALIKADPDNKDYYEANYKKEAARCDELDQQYKKELAQVSKRELVVAHEAFGYLCKAYDLEQMGIEGLSADDEPDPKQMSEVIEFAKKHKVKTIFFEELVSPKVAKTIAKETGASAKMLNPLEGLSNKKIKAGQDYFSVMKQNLSAIKEALSE